MLTEIDNIITVISEILFQMNEMKRGSSYLTASRIGFKELSESVSTESNIIAKNIREIRESVDEIAHISNDNLINISNLAN